MGGDASFEKVWEENFPGTLFKQTKRIKVSMFYDLYQGKSSEERTILWNQAIKIGGGQHLLTWKWRVPLQPDEIDGIHKDETTKKFFGTYFPEIRENTDGYKMASIMRHAIENWDMVLLGRLLDIGKQDGSTANLIDELTTPLYTMILFKGDDKYNYLTGRSPVNMILNRLRGYEENIHIENPDTHALDVMVRIGKLLSRGKFAEQFTSKEKVVLKEIGERPSSLSSLENGHCYSQEDVWNLEKISLDRFFVPNTPIVKRQISDNDKTESRTLTSYFYPVPISENVEKWSRSHLCVSCGRRKQTTDRHRR